jgi:hypothetical protein
VARFSDRSDGTTDVSFKYFLDLHRTFRFLMPFMLRMFERQTQQRIEGLKAFLARPDSYVSDTNGLAYEE